MDVLECCRRLLHVVAAEVIGAPSACSPVVVTPDCWVNRGHFLLFRHNHTATVTSLCSGWASYFAAEKSPNSFPAERPWANRMGSLVGKYLPYFPYS